MRKPHSLLLATILLFPLAVPSAKAASDLEQEYAQVRKIALKDPKVQAAFQKANDRLNDKILEIDPALKPIVEGAHLQHFQPSARTHTVAAGETLASIAEHEHVSVAALVKTNHIADVHKLRVGQKLAIPAKP